MKYCNYEKSTGRIKGYYDDKIHKIIPEPNIEISEEVWLNSINNNHNHINEKGETSLIDFRTTEEVAYQNSLPSQSEIENADYKAKLIENLIELGVI